MRFLSFFLIILFCISCESRQNDPNIQIAVTFTEQIQSEPLEGRLLLLLSTNDVAEPRFQISDGPETQLVFGQNTGLISASEAVVFNEDIFGYPFESLKDIPADTYHIQAVLHRYETFNLSTGHTVKLPMDNGEGQQWNRSPGNLFNKPVKVYLNPDKGFDLTIVMDQKIKPIAPPEDTEWIKHIKIKSEKLSEFWGRDMYLGAHVLLPKGFKEHPEARYPLMVFHGHFPYDFTGFRTEPPAEDLPSDYSDRFGVSGYNRIQQQEAYDFYQRWISPDFPRFLIIKIQHPTPYYDDSYAVNSANQGPYGDAITFELIPYIEQEFRGIGEGWARFLYGGSTGGWEALAVQVMYPEEYNACFAACPDPIDFSAYGLIDIYQDKNAYYYESEHKTVLRPGHRDYLGHVHTSLRDMNYRELALGDRSRSGQQWDIWEATYSPQGDDGYPVRLWDKYSGEINPEVAAYWKEHYDLRHILQRDWDQLGPKLQGKIHIYCGDMDNYYLNNAVYKMEEFLESTTNPYYNGEVQYGDRAEHCWNGDHENPNHISRLRYNTMYVPKIMQRIRESAPAGADLQSWRYE
jgi:hypothetical protein